MLSKPPVFLGYEPVFALAVLDASHLPTRLRLRKRHRLPRAYCEALLRDLSSSAVRPQFASNETYFDH